MQALEERTGAFFVRHATVPHQMTFTNKFGTALPLRQQHNNLQGVLDERPPLWWAAAEVETIAAAPTTPGLAPSFAVNEAAHTSWAQEGGSKYDPTGGFPANLTTTWVGVAHSELVLTALTFVLWALGAVSLLYIATMWTRRALVHTYQRKEDVYGPCASHDKLVGASKLKPAGVSNRKPSM